MEEQTLEGFGLAPLQLLHWHHREAAVGPAWNAVACARITGTLVADELRAALEGVVARHELLRTSFPLLPGTSVPVQRVHDRGSLRFETRDAGEATTEDLLAALAAEPFSPDEPGVLRAILVESADGDHRLLLAQPALAADAASLWNVVRETAAFLRGESSRAAEDEDGDEEPMQFADLAQWLHDSFDSEDAPEALAAWRAVDLGAGLGLRVPLSYDRGGSGFAPRVTGRPFPAEARTALLGTAEACGADPGSVLLAAWQAFLARLSEREEVVCGLVASGRGFEGLDVALGPFARALPVAGRLYPGEAFRELVRRAEQSRSAAEERHEYFDFARAGGRETDFLPYVVELLPVLPPEVSGGLAFTLETRDATSEPFHLKLALDLGAAEAVLRLRYDPRFFGEAEAGCLLEQLETLLTAGCADPDTPADALPLSSAAETARVLGKLAREAPRVDDSVPVHRTISEAARARADVTAVVAEGRSLTHAELQRRANALAHHLRTLGVGPGVHVGLYLDRSTEMLVAILGVLKAGGAYVPLPPGYPAERTSFMLADSGAPVVVTRAAEGASLPPFDGRVVRLDVDWDAIAAAGDAEPDEVAGPEDPAYVIYTSGSTGKPKGVSVRHRNLAHSTRARMEYYGDPVGSYLLLSSFAFDSSVVGLFWTLAQGGTLVLPPDGFEQEIPTVAGLIAEHGITHVLALPSLYGLILETARPEQLRSLVTVIVAGESAAPELLETHAARLPTARLFNEYGPTEGTVWSSVFDCSLPYERPQVPIGRPIPGAELFVVDPERLTPQPIGIAGELLVGGPGVAAGYLDRPELTAERFIPSPFPAPIGGDGPLYRTGDLARFLPDGNLEFLGRIDHQVKIRGYRVELEEIESALSAHPAVREAVVLAREDEPGDRRLVAYATLQNGSPTPAELREYLAAPLPDYMLPAHFVLLDEFPQLPNGKVDRKALPSPELDRSALRTSFVAPSTPLEQVLAAVWGDVLRIDRIGVNDDFFDLGGHSILATQLFARLTDTLQVQIPLRAIFDHPTVASLTERLLSDTSERARVERTAEVVLEVLGA